MSLKGSWRTTTAGIAQFLTVLLAAVYAMLDTDPATVPDLDVIAMSFVTMVALMNARDNKVSSAQAGAK